ncbi:MAG: DegT/DnrJ/EryC1/StrS family aminotransferase [Pseudomonadota bacterium]
MKAPPELERYFMSEYGRAPVIVPSARFGLYAVVKSLFRPGDGVLLSPITCKMVVTALLAAGVLPVFVDVDPDTGNLDIDKLHKKTLSRAKGVITTNLYGTPDRVGELVERVRPHGLRVIEDCAHVVEARVDGARVGTVGDVAILSCSKVLQVHGGIVLSRDAAVAEEIQRTVHREGSRPSRRERIWSQLSMLVPARGRRAVRPVLQALRTRTATRSPPEISARHVEQRLKLLVPAQHASLMSTHDLLSSDGKRYAVQPTSVMVQAIQHKLRAFESTIADKSARNRALIARCDLERREPAYSARYCNLVVPFFTDHRDAIVQRLHEKGLDVSYIYDPPRNHLLGPQGCVDAQRFPERAWEWSRKVLPVNSDFAEEYLGVIREFHPAP